VIGQRVLIIDDNPFNLKLAKYLLVADGLDVYTATTAVDGLAALGAWRPQLVLMDIRLPGMDGLSLTRLLRSDVANDTLWIIAFSADATSQDEQLARSAGCDGYITKPIDVDQFCASVQRYLDSTR
jgi:CheY-like chemotaxis protein